MTIIIVLNFAGFADLQIQLVKNGKKLASEWVKGVVNQTRVLIINTISV